MPSPTTHLAHDRILASTRLGGIDCRRRYRGKPHHLAQLPGDPVNTGVSSVRDADFPGPALPDPRVWTPLRPLLVLRVQGALGRVAAAQLGGGGRAITASTRRAARPRRPARTSRGRRHPQYPGESASGTGEQIVDHEAPGPVLASPHDLRILSRKLDRALVRRRPLQGPARRLSSARSPDSRTCGTSAVSRDCSPRLISSPWPASATTTR